MLDFQVVAVGLVIAVVCVFASGWWIFSVFVTKEKSYEEALAEQRLQNSALLGTLNKPKPKEKKQKKAGKKVKEKSAKEHEDEVDGGESTDSKSSHKQPSQQKHHVEFKEPTVEQEPVKETNKRRSKRDKVRPILLNRDMSVEKISPLDVDLPSANHFEELHPKDEFELMHSHSHNEQEVKEVKEEPVKAVKSAPEQASQGKSKAAAIKVTPIDNSTQTKEIANTVVSTQTNGLPANPPKDKKKKKPVDPLAAGEGIDIEQLSNLVRKAELPNSELQILINVILNKQHEAPTVVDEWSEGKADPLQKLKKQFAEKEKLLADAQEALLSSQRKLKEVRAEQQAEKSQLQTKIRTLETTQASLQTEAHRAHEHMTTTQQQVMVIQDQFNNEMMKVRNLEAEKQEMQMELQQMQMIIVQTQEKENAAQQILLQLQHMKLEMEQKDELLREIEAYKKEAEQCCAAFQRKEKELLTELNEKQIEVNKLHTNLQQQLEEIRLLELNKGQACSELQNVKKRQEEYERSISELNSEIAKLRDEKEALEASRENGAIEEKRAHQVELRNLQNEVSSLKANLEESESKHRADLDAKVTKLQSELSEQREKNDDLRNKNRKLMEAVNEMETVSQTLMAQAKSKENMEDTVAKARQEEQTLNKQLIARLFPDLSIDNSVPHDKWCQQVEVAIRQHVGSLQRPRTPEPVDDTEINKLKSELSHYKAIIDDTEGMLNKLQNHIEREEIQWRKQLEAKDAEIETFKEQQAKQLVADAPALPEMQGVHFAYQCIEKSLPMIVDELREDLLDLQSQLTLEREEKQKLINELSTCRNKESNSSKILEIERLSETAHRLVAEEQKDNSEVQPQKLDSVNSYSLKAINNHSNNTANGPAVTVENNGN